MRLRWWSHYHVWLQVRTKPFDYFEFIARLEIISTEPRRDIIVRRFFAESMRLVIDGLVDAK